jgi:thiamine-phosphate pyrophosphorylase
MKLPIFYPILDVETARRRGVACLDAASQILDAGARILQFRYKGFFSREIFADVEKIANLCSRAGAIFVMNDRVDIAKLLGAPVHLGQEDLPPSEARRIFNGCIGYSTHNEAQLRAAASEPADYLAFGPIFGTASKLNPDPVVGIAELRRLRALTDRPVVAIGGITRQNARGVIEAGADSVAVIGDLFPEDSRIGDRVKEWCEICR